MKAILMVAIFGTGVACAHAQQELRKDDLVAMKNQGISEAEILKRVEGKIVVLSSDDVIALVEADFGEETLNALLKRGQEKETPRPRKTQIAVENRTCMPLWFKVDGRRGVVHFLPRKRRDLAEVPPEKAVAVEIPAGQYAVCWCGAECDLEFAVKEGATMRILVAEEEDDDSCGGPAITMRVIEDRAGEASYVCPMHPDVTSAKPGECRKCGMKLKIVEPKKEEPTGGTAYTCPMHPDVKSAKPGDCPRCGMKLEAVKPKKKDDGHGHKHDD